VFPAAELFTSDQSALKCEILGGTTASGLQHCVYKLGQTLFEFVDQPLLSGRR